MVDATWRPVERVAEVTVGGQSLLLLVDQGLPLRSANDARGHHMDTAKWAVVSTQTAADAVVGDPDCEVASLFVTVRDRWVTIRIASVDRVNRTSIQTAWIATRSAGAWHEKPIESIPLQKQPRHAVIMGTRTRFHAFVTSCTFVEINDE